MGRNPDDGTGCADYPLADLLGHLKIAIPFYPFDDCELEKRFPKYSTARNGRRPRRGETFPEFQTTYGAFYRLLGKAARRPGIDVADGYRTNEGIFLSVRKREESGKTAVIEGFKREMRDGRVVWVSEEGVEIEEAEPRQLTKDLVFPH